MTGFANGSLEANWTLLALTSRASYEATALEPGKHYWFRMCALGAAGASPFSDPAKGFALGFIRRIRELAWAAPGLVILGRLQREAAAPSPGRAGPGPALPGWTPPV